MKVPGVHMGAESTIVIIPQPDCALFCDGNVVCSGEIVLVEFVVGSADESYFAHFLVLFFWYWNSYSNLNCVFCFAVRTN